MVNWNSYNNMVDLKCIYRDRSLKYYGTLFNLKIFKSNLVLFLLIYCYFTQFYRYKQYFNISQIFNYR
jgi:hypothetical protein